MENKEIIIVNDGSTDKETLHVINKFREIRNIVINQPNLGLPAARNVGAYASKESIIFIDSDDWVELES